MGPPARGGSRSFVYAESTMMQGRKRLPKKKADKIEDYRVRLYDYLSRIDDIGPMAAV